MSRTYRNILIGVNALYVALLLLITVPVGRTDTFPWTAIRAKIDSAQTFEDLRPSAHYAVTALEASDREILSLHNLTTSLRITGVAFSALSLLLLYLFFRSKVSNDTKV